MTAIGKIYSKSTILSLKIKFETRGIKSALRGGFYTFINRVYNQLIRSFYGKDEPGSAF
jgi:hypothetical protein